MLRIFSGPVNRVDEPDFNFAGLKRLLNKIDIFLVAAGVLNFAPAEPHLAIDSGEQRLLALGRGWLRNTFLDQIHCVIEQHPGWLTARFVF